MQFRQMQGSIPPHARVPRTAIDKLSVRSIVIVELFKAILTFYIRCLTLALLRISNS